MAGLVVVVVVVVAVAVAVVVVDGSCVVPLLAVFESVRRLHGFCAAVDEVAAVVVVVVVVVVVGVVVVVATAVVVDCALLVFPFTELPEQGRHGGHGVAACEVVSVVAWEPVLSTAVLPHGLLGSL